jgi:hypothetical protein
MDKYLINGAGPINFSDNTKYSTTDGGLNDTTHPVPGDDVHVTVNSGCDVLTAITFDIPPAFHNWVSSQIQRILLQSPIPGLPVLLAYTGTCDFSNCDLEDVSNISPLTAGVTYPSLGASQGIATDGTYFYLISTDDIKKYDALWNLLATRLNTATVDCLRNHMGAGVVYNNKLYATCENDNIANGVYSGQGVGIWNTSDLSFVGFHDLSSVGDEMSGCTIDPIGGIIYTNSYFQNCPYGSRFLKFSLTDFSYLGYLRLSYYIQALQGISYKAGYIYGSADNSAKGIYKINATTGQVWGEIGTTGTAEIEGLDFSTPIMYVLVGGAGHTIYTFTEPASPAALNLSAQSAGDAQGNANIIFPVGATPTWINVNGGNASAGGNWSTGLVPKPQDNVSFACAFGAGKTVTQDVPRIGKSVSWVSATGSPTWLLSNHSYLWGSLNLTGLGQLTHNSKNFYFCGRGNFTLTATSFISKTINGIHTWNPLGVLTFLDSPYQMDGHIDLDYGGLDFSTQNVTATYFNHNSFASCASYIVFGSGVKTFYGGGGTKFSLSGVNGLQLDAGTGTIVLTNSGITGQNLSSTGDVYYNFVDLGNVKVAGAGVYILTITGSMRMKLAVDASLAVKTIIATGTTQTFDDFTRDAGVNVITITGGTFIKAGGCVSLDYLLITNNSALLPVNTWYAGGHSVDGGGNTGWVWAAPVFGLENVRRLAWC